jgi:hypothetical protein
MSVDILSFLDNRSFDAEATHAMGLAYDKARRLLHDTGQPEVVQEIIARRVIEIALTGERDPDIIAEKTLLGFGIEKGS